jgi:hypothetical protein
MNVGIIILVLIVIFFVFAYRELSTCKNIVSKINQDIEATKMDMKQRIKIQMDNCIERVEKFNYDNMQQLKTINYLNNSPITKKICYHTEDGNACEDDGDGKHDIFRRGHSLGESEYFVSGPTNGAERETQLYKHRFEQGATQTDFDQCMSNELCNNGLEQFPNYDPSAGGTMFVKPYNIAISSHASGSQDECNEVLQGLNKVTDLNPSIINANVVDNIMILNEKENRTYESSVNSVPSRKSSVSSNNRSPSHNSESKSVLSKPVSHKSNEAHSKSSSSGKSIKIETLPMPIPMPTSISTPSRQTIRPINHYGIGELKELASKYKIPQSKVINGKRKILNKEELYSSLRKYLESK